MKKLTICVITAMALTVAVPAYAQPAPTAPSNDGNGGEVIAAGIVILLIVKLLGLDGGSLGPKQPTSE